MKAISVHGLDQQLWSFRSLMWLKDRIVSRRFDPSNAANSNWAGRTAAGPRLLWRRFMKKQPNRSGCEGEKAAHPFCVLQDT